MMKTAEEAFGDRRRGLTMFERHDESTAVINASVTEVFAHLDDQARLSAHMSKRSWKMGWGKMEVRLDAQGGKAVGSHIVLDGRILGIHLYLDEVVTVREPPHRKRWRTEGEPRLLVIGQYSMGFNVADLETAVRLTVQIDYALPAQGLSKIVGRLFGRPYARWCTRQMVRDAEKTFAERTSPPAGRTGTRHR